MIDDFSICAEVVFVEVVDSSKIRAVTDKAIGAFSGKVWLLKSQNAFIAVAGRQRRIRLQRLPFNLKRKAAKKKQ